MKADNKRVEINKKAFRERHGIIYYCGFCFKEFKTASGCARHIEAQSVVGFVNPDDIKVRFNNKPKCLKEIAKASPC